MIFCWEYENNLLKNTDFPAGPEEDFVQNAGIFFVRHF